MQDLDELRCNTTDEGTDVQQQREQRQFSAGEEKTPYAAPQRPPPVQVNVPAPRGQIGRYKIGRHLADTLFGGVYYGQDTVSSEWIIIKRSQINNVTRGISTSGNPVQEDLWGEIRLQKKLNACSPKCHYLGVLLDVCQDNMYIYQIMEYYPHGDLYDFVTTWRHGSIPRHKDPPAAPKRDGGAKMDVDGTGDGDDAKYNEPRKLVPVCVTEQRTREYFSQLVQAVYFMHSRRISHRDLSLENTMIDKNKKLRVIDFGLAMEWPVGDPNIWRCRPPPLGKLQYMSPECAKCRDHAVPVDQQPTYDARCNDIWCLGVMLFMMLFGVPPFTVPNSSDARYVYCTRGQIPQLLKIWKRDHLASPAAIDLLHKIFQPEAQRVAMEGIMVHNFLRQREAMIPLPKSG